MSSISGMIKSNRNNLDLRQKKSFFTRQKPKTLPNPPSPQGQKSSSKSILINDKTPQSHRMVSYTTSVICLVLLVILGYKLYYFLPYAFDS